ncbi:LysR family transcriptional regulator ArgP [Sansalvadorimonas sp. 2012CJ34-2]|uniref:HTH-type transcriptional regulator ArgP n=1 Tax=Parendozoicomonas callyspongiae TaxID=2942213 RepID=A0ABT0PG55_9GAMM|nr:LysR family transcriptional regulator ArgP [Sansalvadorimonas sp. 2012CJ34-2]MCL6270323.1 LysR family transcriptional regulator ArgP [Sansalvadorimonas sp. 2012CJ34-2]
MNNLDYRLIAALDAVINKRSFERAAEQLCITQSAVSQRIRQLEKQLGQPLLVRSQPPQPTKTGQRLLALFRRVQLLEKEAMPELQTDNNGQYLPLALAVNPDSLATWLLPALAPLLREEPIELDIRLADESRTLDLLRRGEVLGAISSEPSPVSGCIADRLGRIEYVCVASPYFVERYFKNGVDRESLMTAPATAFDHFDDLHQRYLETHFDLPPGEVPCHIVGTSEAIVSLAANGVAYGMIPDLMIRDKLASGELTEIIPNIRHNRVLFWHRWALESGVMKQVSEYLIRHAKEQLLP